MSTSHHTPIARTANISSTVLNTPLGVLDEQIGDMVDGTDAFTGIDIDGGAIDGATVGANSAAAGTFTDLTITEDINVGSAFLAHLNAIDYTIASVTVDAVEFGSTFLDNNSDFDTSTTFDFVPSVAGWYLLIAQAQWSAALNVNKDMRLSITKNTVNVTEFFMSSGGNFVESMLTMTLAEANGSTDSFQMTCFNGDSVSRDVEGQQVRTIFTGWRIR